MLDDGLCADEIFNGPYVDFAFTCDGQTVFTKPGFIKTRTSKRASCAAPSTRPTSSTSCGRRGRGGDAQRLGLRKYDAAGNPIGDSEGGACR